MNDLNGKNTDRIQAVLNQLLHNLANEFKLGVRININPTLEALATQAADLVVALLRNDPKALLCLAAGDTPRLAYSILAQKAKAAEADFSQCAFVGLDEWIGIPPENEGSCAYFLQQHLFNAIGIRPEQIHLFNALSPDPDAECRKMESIIAARGGIDLMLVGVGMNGHIGFNEPGVSAEAGAHVVTLDETTRRVGQKYFRQTTVLQQGITLGLRNFLDSRQAILMASGAGKADIIKRTLEDPVSNLTPASFIREHPNAVVVLDAAAAARLGKTQN